MSRAPAKIYWLMLVPILLTVLAQSLGKLGMVKAGQGWSYLNIFILLSYFTALLRGFVWLLVLRKVRISVAYPLFSLTFVLVAVVSVWCFGGQVTPGNVAGSALIILGIALLGLGERRGHEG